MKATQLVSPAGYYGAERWIVALGRYLADVDVDADLVIIGDHPEQTEQLREAWAALGLPVSLIAEASRFDPRTIRHVARHLRSRGTSILHSHGYKSDFIGLLAARWTRVPLVITPHGFGVDCEPRQLLYAKIGAWAARRADAVAPLSMPLLQTMRESGVAERALKLIPNAVDLHEIDCVNVHRSERSTNGLCEIVYIGRLIPGKRVRHLIDIASALRECGLSVLIHIVGEGPERESLESRIQMEHLGENVRLHGFRADRLKLVADANLFVLPSASEGTPRSMMEAMALGTPVVAYDIPGVRPLVTHEVTGLLAADGNKADLIEQCRRVLVDETLSTRLADAARSHIRTAFSGRRLAVDYAELYKELI